MKLFVAFSVVQVAALGFFGFGMRAMDARLAQIAEQARTPIVAVEAGGAAATPQAPDFFRTSGPTAEEIRRIIREEIAAARTPDPQRLPAIAAPGHSDADNADRLNRARLRLDGYIAQGSIDGAEIAKLEGEMADLSPQQRQEILTKLAKAINAGQLENRF